MPYQSPSHRESERLFLRFPYFNPGAPAFREPLARLATGQRLDVPTGSLFGLLHWGLTLAQETSWPAGAPITARDDGLASHSGPVEAAASTTAAAIQLHLPQQTIEVGDGSSVTCGGRLYWRFRWAGLNTLATLGYETTWRSALPPATDLLPTEALPGSGGAVGVYISSYGVRVLLSLLLSAAAAVGMYWLSATAPQPQPFGGPAPVWP